MVSDVNDPSKQRLRKAITCLFLELPKSIVDDVSARAEAVIDDLEWCADALNRASDELGQSDVPLTKSIVSLLDEIKDNLTARDLVEIKDEDEQANS